MVSLWKKYGFIGLFMLLSGFSGCKKPEFSPVIKILGKGGMGNSHMYPMNSKASYMEALLYNLDGVEVDVQLTKDAQLAAFHTENLEATTNMTGRIYDYTWEELQEQCRYNNHRFRSYSLISLDEITEIYPPDALLSLDIKIFIPSDEEADAYMNAYINALRDLYTKHRNIMLESSSPYYARMLKAVNEQIPVLLVSNSASEGLDLVIDNELDGIVLPDTEANEDVMERARNHGMMVVIWETSKSIHYSLDLEPDFFQATSVKRFGR